MVRGAIFGIYASKPTLLYREIVPNCQKALILLAFSAIDYPEPPPPIWCCLCWVRRSDCESCVQQFANRPSVIGEAQRLSRRAADRLVPAAEIVMGDVERHSRRVVL